jgi:tape measure domain-containing protein
MLGELIVLLRADTTKLKKDLKKSKQDLSAYAQGAAASLKGMKNLVAGAFATAGIAAFTKAVFDAGVEIERLKVGVSAASQSVTAGANAIAFIRSEADRLGFNFKDRIEDFKTLSAAAMGTTMQGEGTVEMFKALTEASVSLQLTSPATSSVLLAVSQMMSKGKVTAEELRLQLAERLPGAVRIMADSMGITVRELDKLLEQGKVGIESLGGFAKELRKNFQGPAVAASETLRAELNRLQTAWFDLKVALFKPFEDVVAKGVRGITEAFKELTLVMKKMPVEAQYVMEQLKAIVGVFGAVIAVSVDHIKALASSGITEEVMQFGDAFDEVAIKATKATRSVKSFTDRTMEIFNSLQKAEEAKAAGMKKIAADMEDSGAKGEQAFIEEMTEYKTNYKDVERDFESINFEIHSGISSEQLKVFDHYQQITGMRQKYFAESRTLWSDAQGVANVFFGVELGMERKKVAFLEKSEADKAKIRKQTAQNMISDSAFAFKEFGNKNRQFFEVFKAIEIAKTVISTLSGAQSAFTAMAGIPYVGPALGIAAAAAAVLAGMARVNQIRSMTPGGGGSASGGGASVPGIPSAPAPPIDLELPEAEPRTQIIVQNPTLDSEERMLQLMEQLRQFTEEKDITTTQAETAIT